MATQAQRERVKKVLNNLNIDASQEKVGDIVMQQGVAVANAAGSAPTKAEFDALLASLRAADIIAT